MPTVPVYETAGLSASVMRPFRSRVIVMSAMSIEDTAGFVATPDMVKSDATPPETDSEITSTMVSVSDTEASVTVGGVASIAISTGVDARLRLSSASRAAFSSIVTVTIPSDAPRVTTKS